MCIGCFAGKYTSIHINNRGDVEPYIFTHFAQVNIKGTSLKDTMNLLSDIAEEIDEYAKGGKDIYGEVWLKEKGNFSRAKHSKPES